MKIQAWITIPTMKTRKTIKKSGVLITGDSSVRGFGLKIQDKGIDGLVIQQSKQMVCNDIYQLKDENILILGYSLNDVRQLPVQPIT